MIDISYREFARNFCKYCNDKQEYRVVKPNNDVVGYWTPDYKMKPAEYLDLAVGQEKESVRQLEQVPSDKVVELIREIMPDDSRTVNSGIAVMCVRHPKNFAHYEGDIYEDGEEKHVFICHDCYNSQPRKKLFKKL